jgi:hypothetical protein
MVESSLSEEKGNIRTGRKKQNGKNFHGAKKILDEQIYI